MDDSMLERPRERMRRAGVKALTDRELVAVVLGNGIVGKDCMTVAGLALEAIGGLHGMAQAEPGPLSRLTGIGPVQGARLVAALELGRRAVANPAARGQPVRGPADLEPLLRSHLGGQTRESFGLVLLDARMHCLGFRSLSRGTVTGTSVSVREAFVSVLNTRAAAVVLSHNHPSGDPTPSKEDLDVTRRMVDAGRALELPVLDHLIVGDHILSLFEAGLMPPSPPCGPRPPSGKGRGGGRRNAAVSGLGRGPVAGSGCPGHGESDPSSPG